LPSVGPGEASRVRRPLSTLDDLVFGKDRLSPLERLVDRLSGRHAVVHHVKLGDAEDVPKPPSKQDVVIAMLRLPEGATVDEVASVTGWQRHTVRGVFSGTLKKKLGLTLASAKEERGRVYRIAEPASP
jgi:hypothetical protein